MAAPPPFTITRTIDASPGEVFEAWIDPALMTLWFAPPPCTVTTATADPRPGGHYSIAVVDPDGNVHTTTGEYRELIPGRRLVKTWAYHGPFPYDSTPTLVTVDFRELRPGVTEITVTHSQLQDEEAREGVGAGWALCLEQLQNLMTRELDDP